MSCKFSRPFDKSLLEKDAVAVVILKHVYIFASSCASKHSIDLQSLLSPSRLFFEIPSARETIALLSHDGPRFLAAVIFKKILINFNYGRFYQTVRAFPVAKKKISSSFIFKARVNISCQSQGSTK